MISALWPGARLLGCLPALPVHLGNCPSVSFLPSATTAKKPIGCTFPIHLEMRQQNQVSSLSRALGLSVPYSVHLVLRAGGCVQHVLHPQLFPSPALPFQLLQGCLWSGLKSLWECFPVLPRIQPLPLNAGVRSEALRINNYPRIPLLMLPQVSWVFKTNLDD